METDINKYYKSRRNRVTDCLVAVIVIVIAGYLVLFQEQHTVPSEIPANTIEGMADISDGDSIRIHGQRIRIAGIDAPELAQYCEKDGRKFACGQQSTEYLRSLVGNQLVKCLWTEKDRYDRILGYCFSGETDLNRVMVLDGWAISYGGYQLEEREARRQKRGIWQWKFQRPGEWRRDHPRQNRKIPDK